MPPVKSGLCESHSELAREVTAVSTSLTFVLGRIQEVTERFSNDVGSIADKMGVIERNFAREMEKRDEAHVATMERLSTLEVNNSVSRVKLAFIGAIGGLTASGIVTIVVFIFIKSILNGA